VLLILSVNHEIYEVLRPSHEVWEDKVLGRYLPMSHGGRSLLCRREMRTMQFGSCTQQIELFVE